MKNILVMIVMALLVIGIAVILYGNFKTEPMDANVANNSILDDANAGLENFINDIIEEENEKNKENNETNNDKSNTQTSENKGNTQSTNSSATTVENQVTPGEKRAVELAKEQWKKDGGDSEGVSFNNVMIQGDGKYIVSVNDSKTTKVICRYVVDTSTGVVEEQ